MSIHFLAANTSTAPNASAPIIRTPRLVLRPFAEADAEPLLALFANWNVIGNLATPPWPYSRNDAQAFVSHAARGGFADRSAYAITLNGYFIGSISARLVHANTLQSGTGPNLAFWLGQPYWGRGFMTEAADALVRHLSPPSSTTPCMRARSPVSLASPLQVRTESASCATARGQGLIPCRPRGGGRVPHIGTVLTRARFRDTRAQPHDGPRRVSPPRPHRGTAAGSRRLTIPWPAAHPCGRFFSGARPRRTVPLADIGATNSRFALYGADGRPDRVVKFRGDEVASFEAAIARYHAEVGVETRAAVVAIASPVEGDAIAMTNRSWSFRLSDLARRFGWRRVRGLNDFEAVAWGTVWLAPGDAETLGPAGAAEPRGVKVVFGPGTGLGVAALVPVGEGALARWQVIPTEGGHVSFGPAAPDEAAMFEAMHAHHGPVSAEMIVSVRGSSGCTRRCTAARPGFRPSRWWRARTPATRPRARR